MLTITHAFSELSFFAGRGFEIFWVTKMWLKRYEVNTCCWKKGMLGFTRYRVTTQVQFEKLQFLQNAIKHNIPVCVVIRICVKTNLIFKSHWKALFASKILFDFYVFHMISILCLYLFQRNGPFISKERGWILDEEKDTKLSFPVKF